MEQRGSKIRRPDAREPDLVFLPPEAIEETGQQWQEKDLDEPIAIKDSSLDEVTADD